MKKKIHLIIYMGLLCCAQVHAQQWIGAISDADAHIPSNRNYVGTGTLNAKGKPDWKATNPLSQQSIWLRKNLKVAKSVKQATVQIAGLGFYELSLNGTKVSHDILAPLWSDYDKTVFYNTYDVTALLQKGKNQIGVLLGNGFYNEQGGRYAKMRISYGPPTLHFVMSVVYQDGTQERIVSDDSWQYALNGITFNSIYGGEDEDARIIAKKWNPVVIQQGPKGKLRPQEASPIREMERYPVKTINHLTAEQIKKASTAKHTIPAGTFVLDMGQNLAGYPEIWVSGKSGQQVRLYLSETLTPEGACNQKQTGSPYYLTYTLGGKSQKQADGTRSEYWHPHFTYYGYRYIQVEGAVMKGEPNPEGKPVIENINSVFVYNSAAKTGSFECSNELFNQTYRIIDRAVRSNWQGVWTDCPHREKLGWLEQDWLNGEGLVYNYDCKAMIRQTMQNIADAQHDNGAVPTTAPEYIFFKGKWLDPFAESPEWGGALVALPFLYREHYGDDSLIRQYYPQMSRYVDYLHSKDSCYILKQGLGDWYDYGKGRSGFSQNTSMPLVATAHYYQWTKMVQQAAALCGDTEAADRYAALAVDIRQAFQKEFLPKEMHSQAAYAIALSMGLVPAEQRQAMLDSLVADIHAHGDRLTTGDVGNRYLFQILLDNGLGELWYKMLNHDDVPGYGFQIKKDMTTLTEQWNPEMGASMNHFMMAHINNHFIPNIVGIQMHQGKLTIAPMPVGDLQWAKGSAQLPDGKMVSVEWHKNPNHQLEVKVSAADDVEYQIILSNEKEHNDRRYHGNHVFVGKWTE